MEPGEEAFLLHWPVDVPPAQTWELREPPVMFHRVGLTCCLVESDETCVARGGACDVEGRYISIDPIIISTRVIITVT